MGRVISGSHPESSGWPMTNLEREENAAILLSHSTFKPEFAPHTGQFISDLYEKVVQVQGPTVEEREPCPFCFDIGEMVSRGYDSSDVSVERCDCPAGKGKL